MDDPVVDPDGGPIADRREFEWRRPLDSGLMATTDRSVDPE
jgi:hypothetical protein